MLKIFKKGHRILTSDVETWVVRWNQIYGRYMDDYKEVAQFFTDKDEAKDFKEALQKANRLLGHTAGHLTNIICEKVENKGCE